MTGSSVPLSKIPTLLHPAARKSRSVRSSPDTGSVRARILPQDIEAIEARSQSALRQIVDTIDLEEGTEQAQRLVGFLAACYDGTRYPLDLSDLRELDPPLAQACIDYLNFHRLTSTDVHQRLRGGEAWLLRCIAHYQL